VKTVSTITSFGVAFKKGFYPDIFSNADNQQSDWWYVTVILYISISFTNRIEIILVYGLLKKMIYFQEKETIITYYRIIYVSIAPVDIAVDNSYT